MPFDVHFDRRAERDFHELPPDVRSRFYPIFAELGRDPFRPRPGCDVRALKGARGAFAVRVGRYRGVYVVVGGGVTFLRFSHRRNV